jgi:hypothetical protein
MKQEKNSGPAELVLTATVARRFYSDGATTSDNAGVRTRARRAGDAQALVGNRSRA